MQRFVMTLLLGLVGFLPLSQAYPYLVRIPLSDRECEGIFVLLDLIISEQNELKIKVLSSGFYDDCDETEDRVVPLGTPSQEILDALPLLLRSGLLPNASNLKSASEDSVIPAPATLKLVPNPASQGRVRATVGLPDDKTLQPDASGLLTLMDINGKVLVRKTISSTEGWQQELEYGDTPPGLYLVKLQMDGQAPVTEPLIIH